MLQYGKVIINICMHALELTGASASTALWDCRKALVDMLDREHNILQFATSPREINWSWKRNIPTWCTKKGQNNALYSLVCTVEPLLTDILYNGHLPATDNSNCTNSLCHSHNTKEASLQRTPLCFGERTLLGSLDPRPYWICRAWFPMFDITWVEPRQRYCTETSLWQRPQATYSLL